MNYKYELHCHTKEVSRCGAVPAAEIVKMYKENGYDGIVITDHNVRETLSVVDRAYLVYNGRLLKEGTSNELVNDPEVRAKYLGEDFHM